MNFLRFLEGIGTRKSRLHVTLGKLGLFLAIFAAATFSNAAIAPQGSIIVNAASSSQSIESSLQTVTSNTVQSTVGPPIPVIPTLTKNFIDQQIALGGSTALRFTLTNARGNPAQSGLAFTDILPSGLRLSVGAAATVTGVGCAANVALTFPSTISVSGGTMGAGTTSCVITINSITHVAGGNPDCSANPAAFTNGSTSIAGLVNVINSVTNQCLTVATQNGVLINGQTVTLTPGARYAFPHTLINGPLADTYKLAVNNLDGSFDFTDIQIFADANGDGVADNAIPLRDNINLGPNEAFKFVVVVNVPLSATTGTTDEVRVSAASVLPARLPIAPNVDHVDIFIPPVAPPVVEATLFKMLSQKSGVSPSGNYTVSIRYANSGHPDATKVNMVVSDTLPTGMLYVPGSLRVKPMPENVSVPLPASSGNATLHGAIATYATTANSVSVNFSRLLPAVEGMLEFDVSIAAGIAADTVLQNTAQVVWADTLGVVVAPRTSNTVDFTVTAVDAVSLRGVTLPSVLPGTTVTFENILTNRSARTDTFDITLTGGTFPVGTAIRVYKSDGVTLLADSNGNGVADTGPVAAGATYRIIVTADLPRDATGGPYRITKNAQSISNARVRASDDDIVGVISTFCKVVLEPNNVGRVIQGGAINYRHVLTNIGNCTETITIPSNYLSGVVVGANGQGTAANTFAGDKSSVASGSAALLVTQGWRAQAFVDSGDSRGAALAGVLDPLDKELDTSMSFRLAPGDSMIFHDRVIAPPLAANGERNVTTMRVVASGSGVLSATDTTTVVLTTGPIGDGRGPTGDITDEILGYIDPLFQRSTVWGLIGKDLYLRANAPSCNSDPTVIERRTIIITGPNGEREELIAIETGVDTGIFQAEVLKVRRPPVIARDIILEGQPFDVYQVELIGCGKKITTTLTLIDPNGVVFDSRTNEPIAGATVRIVTASGGVCSNNLATVRRLVRGEVVAAPSTVVTGADGRFDFELVQPGDYCLLVNTPNGYTWASRVPAGQLPAGRSILSVTPTTGGSYGGVFRVGPETGPVVVDIPLDGGKLGGLFVQKTVGRAIVEMGEFTDYTVTVSNGTGFALNQNDVFLNDTLPAGFTFVAGSARKDGVALANPTGGAGPQLVFNLGRMARDQKVVVTYRVRVGPGAVQGDGVNRVMASYRITSSTAFTGTGGIPAGTDTTITSESNVATAKVEIAGGVFTDRAYIVGKVYADCNMDRMQTPAEKDAAGELGIPGVKLVLEDGTSATTDSEGKYSFYGLLAKTHVLKVDRTSLPAGIGAEDFVLLSNRNLGKGDSRFVDLKNGELHKANFAIKTCTESVMAQITSRRTAAQSLKTEIEGRLQQKLESDSSPRAQNDLRALPASGEVGNAAPTASVSTAGALGSVAPANAVARFDSLAVSQAAIKPKKRESLARAPLTPLEDLLPDLDNVLGFVGLKTGDVLAYTQTVVRVKGAAGTTFKLQVNGKDIAEDRVGKRAVLEDKAAQAWEYFGIDLQVGENTLSVSQIDSFGNARGTSAIKVVAPGEPAKFKITFRAPKGEAIADGVTPAIVIVDVLDRNNVPVTARTTIELSSTVGRWNVEDISPAEAGLQTFIEGGRGEFELLPPTEPEQALINVKIGTVTGEFKLDFLPNLRELLAVGVIEGVLNLRKLDAKGLQPARAQDGFEQEIKSFARSFNGGEREGAARAAMYLKGKVRGEYLLTLAYDSDKNTRERLFRDIQPDEFYPIYGDSSTRGFDAQSTGRFYVRVDKKKSYVLYGDFNTSQATDARKLSNYSRSLTGIKQHFETPFLAANAFASRDSTRQIIDEFPTNGTSGPFTLTRSGSLLNSEKLEVITRDRNQRSIIIKAVPLSRFADYELEPLTGRILFKAPIPSLDENLNPLSIRVTYEVEQGGAQFWVAGVDAQMKIGERFEVGGVVVDDRNPLDKFRMMGVNGIAKLADKTFLVAEVVRTHRVSSESAIRSSLPGAFPSSIPGDRTGDAKRIELRHTDGDLEATAYAGRASQGFDNPSSSLTQGRQEIGAKASYRLDEKTRIKGELLRTEELATHSKRDGMFIAVERTVAEGLRVEGGIRHAREADASSAVAVPGATPNELTAARVRITGELPFVKDASAYVEAEVDVKDTSKKLGAVGADFRLGTAGRLYARHEFISSITGPYGLNTQQRQNATVIGINTDYMAGGNVFSEYRVRDAISGGDAEAALGLRNTWTLREGLKLQTGFERVHALSGPGTSESAAVTLGVDYTANPLWKGSTRFEVRSGKTSDSILATAAVAAKMSRDWTLLGRNTFSRIENKGTTNGTNQQERLQVGMAYRDTDTDTWNALGRVEHRVENDSTQANLALKRTVELLSIQGNWQPRRPFIFSGRYAAKWVNEKSNGFASRNGAQLLAGRALWEFAPRLDLGLNVSTMFANGAQSKQFGLGVELGYMVMENLWLSGGVNFFGYRDDDLASGEYTNKGVFVRLRYKFDEDIFGSSKSAKSTSAKDAATAENPAASAAGVK